MSTHNQKSINITFIKFILSICSAVGILVCVLIVGGVSSTLAAKEKTMQRKVYFPNTEELQDDEMRVVALGTGTPNIRRSQASASWLVELGNGEKFIFYIGTGSLANLAALEIPYTYLDKIFISHLHVNHIGDLDALYIGGWVSNRTCPFGKPAYPS